MPSGCSRLPFRSPLLPAVVLCLLGLTGCLPHSCTREESRALLPADSLSRQAAALVPMDTLRAAWAANGQGETVLTNPRTVVFGNGERIFVSDTERNSLFVFGTDSTFIGEITNEALRYPYLAGVRGDTVLVFNPEARRVDFLLDTLVVRSLNLPDDLPKHGLFQYVAASDTALFYKGIGKDLDGFLARLDADRRLTDRRPLPPPYWRHAGLLRVWGDSLLSLSGFRPVIDVLPGDGPIDTLALSGFDSPMLARSRLYLLGEIDEPPLLSASAAPAGDRLFVLNMRPGWLRIDVYDHAGHLRNVLTQANPAFNKNYYPTDLAARSLGHGAYEIAVISTKPQARLTLYRWTAPVE